MSNDILWTFNLIVVQLNWFSLVTRQLTTHSFSQAMLEALTDQVSTAC